MNQFWSFILQYASNAGEKVACHYKERSLTFWIVASRVLSLLKFAVGQGFFLYTNILCPASVGTTVGYFWERACTARYEIFYGKHVSLWPQNWSARTQGHRILFAEVLPFWDSRGKCCERQVRLSRLEGRKAHDWALYWQLFETLNYTLCNGMRLFSRRCLRTAKYSFEIGSFFMKDLVHDSGWYIVDNKRTPYIEWPEKCLTLA
jgi:hypothetical protein